MEMNTTANQVLSLHATASQLEAMNELETLLTCRLCQKMVQQPASLGCGHTFCEVCITTYAENNWYCPVCNLPMAMTRKGGGKYYQSNPMILELVESLTTMKVALQNAPKCWWKYQVPLINDSLPHKDTCNAAAAEETLVEDSVKSDDETDDDDGALYETAQY
ncbi:hypothetical protein MPSEU_000682600 [Mayamaea pseudoterrestris]|nr:hypothetical protein MPSEU_000682600 [Mayamaea pseudoterrestris]